MVQTFENRALLLKLNLFCQTYTVIFTAIAQIKTAKY